MKVGADIAFSVLSSLARDRYEIVASCCQPCSLSAVFAVVERLCDAIRRRSRKSFSRAARVRSE